MNTERSVCCFQDDDRVRLGLLLHMVSKDWRAAIDERMRPMGLSSAQLTVICSLAINDRPLTQRELAEATNVESPSMVRLLDRLQAKGWLTREPSPTDRRIKFVVLTDKGLRSFDELVKVAQRLELELIAGIAEEKLRTAREVLETIHERLCGEAPCVL